MMILFINISRPSQARRFTLFSSCYCSALYFNIPVSIAFRMLEYVLYYVLNVLSRGVLQKVKETPQNAHFDFTENCVHVRQFCLVVQPLCYRMKGVKAFSKG